MSTPLVLGFDVGGTKTAWGLVDENGAITESGRFPTPTERSKFLERLSAVIAAHKPAAVGIGIAGTVSADHKDTIVCPNIPELSHFELVTELQKDHDLPIMIDNDARCALIGEVWMGAAREASSAVLITIGTGVGGAVMQKGQILPHPTDISQEIGRIVADPNDLMPTPTGTGTVEALLGGRNLAERFGIPMNEVVVGARKGDAEMVDLFTQISHYFLQSVRAIHNIYNCKMILVGGIGSKDLDLYLQDTPPCPVLPAKLGENAGILGAARLAWDAYEVKVADEAEWGTDEEA